MHANNTQLTCTGVVGSDRAPWQLGAQLDGGVGSTGKDGGLCRQPIKPNEHLLAGWKDGRFGGGEVGWEALGGCWGGLR